MRVGFQLSSCLRPGHGAAVGLAVVSRGGPSPLLHLAKPPGRLARSSFSEVRHPSWLWSPRATEFCVPAVAGDQGSGMQC